MTPAAKPIQIKFFDEAFTLNIPSSLQLAFHSWPGIPANNEAQPLHKPAEPSLATQLYTSLVYTGIFRTHARAAIQMRGLDRPELPQYSSPDPRQRLPDGRP